MPADLDHAKYMSLTTYRKDGTPVSTPVWLVGRGGTYEFTTQSDSFKVKRIRHTDTVEVAVCDARGNVHDGAPRYSGTAELVEGPGKDRIRSAVRSKYPVAARLLAIPMAIRSARSEGETIGVRVNVPG